MRVNSVNLCDFSAKPEAIAPSSQAIATAKAMAEKSIDSLKLMGGVFPLQSSSNLLQRLNPHCGATEEGVVMRNVIQVLWHKEAPSHVRGKLPKASHDAPLASR